MVKRILSVLTIWGLIVGCCVAFSEEPQPAAPSKPAAAPSAPAPPTTASSSQQSAAPATFTEPSAGEQMQALARHAGKGMICYTANRGALAYAGKEAIPLALKTVPAPRK